MTTPREGKSNREFPLQQPTWVAYQSWKKAIGAITVSGTKLRNPLGAHISNPHQEARWFMDQDQSNIYRKLPGGTYEVYKRPRSGRSTRFGSTYILSDALIQDVIPTHHVSVRSWNGLTLRYHSSCPIWKERPLDYPHTLLGTLESWRNPTLWTTFRYDGEDCGWIFRGLM